MQTGAQTVVAECPFCIKMLEQAAQATSGGSEIRIKDIAEIVAEALSAQEPTTARQPSDRPGTAQMKEGT
jgi:hypothetical protein